METIGLNGTGGPGHCVQLIHYISLLKHQVLLPLMLSTRSYHINELKETSNKINGRIQEHPPFVFVSSKMDASSFHRGSFVRGLLFVPVSMSVGLTTSMTRFLCQDIAPSLIDILKIMKVACNLEPSKSILSILLKRMFKKIIKIIL